VWAWKRPSTPSGSSECSQRYQHELWTGDAAEIRAARVRKQKTDARDALHILDLLLTNRFPRIWIPSPVERDVRQLVRHRHKLVRVRTSVMNQLHALAIGQGLCRKQKLWSSAGRKELEALTLDRWAHRRRQDLLQMLDQLNPPIAELDRAVLQEAQSRPPAVRLMNEPGVGPVTALAFVLTIGAVDRFPRSKQVVSYLGLNPTEASSGGRQRLGSISKQGNAMLRHLLVEAAQTASKLNPELRRDSQRLKFRRGSPKLRGAVRPYTHFEVPCRLRGSRRGGRTESNWADCAQFSTGTPKAAHKQREAFREHAVECKTLPKEFVTDAAPCLTGSRRKRWERTYCVQRPRYPPVVEVGGPQACIDPRRRRGDTGDIPRSYVELRQVVIQKQ
jgi:transposase